VFGTGYLDQIWTTLNRASDLSEGDRDAFFALPFRSRPVEAGEAIEREDAAPHDCFAIVTGFAYSSKVLRDGSRQILSVHMPGDFLNTASLIHPGTAQDIQMLTPGRLASISSTALHHLLAQHPRIERALWRQTAIEASIFGEWIANIGRRDAQARVAHLLCEFALRLRTVEDGDDGTFDVPMTQGQLADATGLTAVHVNRVLQKLNRAGLIRCNVKSVTIEDMQGLAAAADFDERYLGERLVRGSRTAATPIPT